MPLHPIGQVTPRGILDIGRGCPNRCEFCFYLHQPMIGFEKKEELKATLDAIKAAGKTYYDITGGEPSLHPDLPEVVAYGRSIGLYGCLINSGLWLKDGKKDVGPKLISAGIHDFRMSVHGVGPIFEAMVNAPFPNAWERMRASLDWLRDINFPFQANAVVTATNYKHLPDLATFLRDYPVRILNLLSFRYYYEWTAEKVAESKVEIQEREAAPWMEKAAEIAEHAGIAVNFRYVPYCSLTEERRKHQVGVRNYQFDPHEWDNLGETVESALNRSEAMVRQRNTFGHPCFKCRARPICDGVNKQYIERWGWDEFKPITGPGGSITDVNHYRHQNPQAHTLKDI